MNELERIIYISYIYYLIYIKGVRATPDAFVLLFLRSLCAFAVDLLLHGGNLRLHLRVVLFLLIPSLRSHLNRDDPQRLCM